MPTDLMALFQRLSSSDQRASGRTYRSCLRMVMLCSAVPGRRFAFIAPTATAARFAMDTIRSMVQPLRGFAQLDWIKYEIKFGNGSTLHILIPAMIREKVAGRHFSVIENDHYVDEAGLLDPRDRAILAGAIESDGID